MVRQITAFSNSTVKLLRSLRDKKARRAEGLFLAEGLRILAEARDSGRLPEIVAFSAEGAKHPLAAEIIEATEAAGGDAIETDPERRTARPHCCEIDHDDLAAELLARERLDGGECHYLRLATHYVVT